MNIEHLYGRRELVYWCDIPQETSSKVQILKTMDISNRIRCRRCNFTCPPRDAELPGGHFYCPNCINLGRVSTLARFYHVSEPNQFPSIKEPMSWEGGLSPLQQKVAKEVTTSMAKHEKRLLWAVTGAGKTEMIFPSIEQSIKKGERVCIASPRVDVILELFPRIQKAFGKVKIALLHGKQEEPYCYRQLTICTTHQLLRFYHAFDLLIIDEVDSFPYAADKSLMFAAKQAIKETAGLLMLTATPGKHLLKAIRQNKLKVSYLPIRYHGHLLPIIRPQIIGDWKKKFEKGILPPVVKLWIKQRLMTGREFLLFVPNVYDLPIVNNVLHHAFKNAAFETVHAADPDRLEKVLRMRHHQLNFLITTAILERGVTFPGIDVAVLGADEITFSSSALVQIAGRAGRSKDRPNGIVTFWINSFSCAVKDAIWQINYLNGKGRKIRNELSNL